MEGPAIVSGCLASPLGAQLLSEDASSWLWVRPLGSMTILLYRGDSVFGKPCFTSIFFQMTKSHSLKLYDVISRIPHNAMTACHSYAFQSYPVHKEFFVIIKLESYLQEICQRPVVGAMLYCH